MIDDHIRAYYERGWERDRLTRDGDALELVRTRELLQRYLPSPPSKILDVGGGAGVYAAWLARAGHQVHLIDPIPLHAEQAIAAAAAQPEHPFSASIGDARNLEIASESVDAVLLMGPLYHLTERNDRLAALREATRVVRPNGVIVAVAISRFGSLLDALNQGILGDPIVRPMIERTLQDGQHRNLSSDRHPGWFTTAYFHLPAELAGEIAENGLQLDALVGIEGPGGLVGDGWREPAQRESILRAARAVEAEPNLLGLSSHILAVARKPPGS